MNKVGYGLRSESGQGIVEYILLLVVVITLVLALANRFFKPFRNWADFYVGAYVECLLDQGQLPSLGGENALQDCDPPPNEFAGGGGTSGGSTNRNSETDSRRGGEDEEGRGRDSRNRSGSGRGDEGNLQARGGRSFKRVRVGGFDNGDSGKSSKISVAEVESKSADKTKYFRSRQTASAFRSGQGRAQRVTGLRGLMAAEREKIEKREKKVNKNVASVAGGATDRGQKKFAVDPKQKKAKEVALEAGSWSIGQFLRYLLIIVIVIALVLFVGGQLIQISKSMEK